MANDDKPKTVTLHHPTLEVSRDVPAESVDEWTDAGWRKTKPTK